APEYISAELISGGTSEKLIDS
ncbi:MAG: hypothetical protein QOI79_1627, partial [Mycobacterium sp.]|nr:hypothetical protein [Mycobacterium sp.]